MVQKTTWVHLGYDINNGGINKYMIVAGRNLNDIKVESVYYDVVYLHGIWLLNKMEIWDTDIGMNTLRLRYSRKFTSSHGFILLIGKAKILLLPDYYMVNSRLALDGMKCLLVVSDIWYYLCAIWNLLFWCNRTRTYTNILMCMLMTYKL